MKRSFFCNNTRLFLWDSFNWLCRPHPLWCWFSSGAARKHELSRTLGAAQDANGYLAMLIVTKSVSNTHLLTRKETQANQGYHQNHWWVYGLKRWVKGIPKTPSNREVGILYRTCRQCWWLIVGWLNVNSSKARDRKKFNRQLFIKTPTVYTSQAYLLFMI